MKASRKRFSAEFKGKVALEALVDNLTVAFEKPGGKSKAGDQDVGKLYEEIGKLKVENDLLARKLGR